MNMPLLLKGRRLRLFYRLLVNAIAQAGAVVASAYLIRFAFNHLITDSNRYPASSTLWIGCGLFANAILIGWLRRTERIDAEELGQRYIHRIRVMLFKHMVQMAPRSLQQKSRGAMMLRFVGDLNALRRWVSLGLVRVTVGGVTSLCALAAMAYINLMLAIGSALILGLGAGFALNLGKHIRDAVKESRRRRSFLISNVNEKITNMTVVQAFGQTDLEQRRVERQSRRLKKAMVQRAKQIGLMRGITQCTTAMTAGVTLLLGSSEINSGRATPGDVVAAMAVVGFLVPALRDLSRVYEYFQEARISEQKIRKFFSQSSLVEEIVGAPDIKFSSGRLEFEAVKLSGVMDGITVTAEPGQTIALIGPNGAGKSTMLALAARLIDPDGGRILINGRNIAQLSLMSVRRAIGIVSPDLPLLRGTVENNLRYRWPDAPEDEIERVRQVCGINEILTDLPDGDQTRIVEGGLNLSLGQRQRIAIARALLGSPPILMLDEADAHLDQGAAKILNGVLRQYQGTVLIVTHHIQHLSKVDAVWHMRNGRLISVTPRTHPLPSQALSAG